MPNQLAQTKKRKTVAEHAAVLALLDRIAEAESTTSTELLRSAARDVVRRHVGKKTVSTELQDIFRAYAPELPRAVSSAKEVSHYKREAREYDDLALDLGFNQAAEVQARNSIHRASSAPVLVGSL